MTISKPIRYAKPCMTNLPPELGRMIFDAILNPPPFDYSKLKKECAQAEHQLARIASEVKDNELASK